MSGTYSPAVLILEPDDQVAAKYTQFFEGSWRVERAKTCEEALELAARLAFQFMIFDLRLPDTTGLQAWLLLKARQPGMFGIITTSSPSLQASIKVDDKQILAFLKKPIRRRTLARLVSRVSQPRAAEPSLALAPCPAE